VFSKPLLEQSLSHLILELRNASDTGSLPMVRVGGRNSLASAVLLCPASIACHRNISLAKTAFAGRCVWLARRSWSALIVAMRSMIHFILLLSGERGIDDCESVLSALEANVRNPREPGLNAQGWYLHRAW